MSPPELRREWCLAYVLVTWRRDIGPLVRKAYKAEEPERAEHAAEALRRLRGLVTALESVQEDDA